MRTYLVDATNAARRGAYDPRFPEMEEARAGELVEKLTALSAAAAGRISIELVFDGPRRPLPGVAAPVSIRFSGERSADELILGTARSLLAQGRGVVVATEDSQLRESIELEGGRVIRFGELFDRLRSGKGFTLAEVLVVVLIIGILTVFGTAHLQKAMESQAAENAAAQVRAIGAGNRLFHVNNNVYTNGNPYTNALCSGNSCDSSANPCNLITCKYIRDYDWDGSKYIFYALNLDPTPCGLTGPPAQLIYVACAKRKAGAAAAYAGWGYTMDVNGNVQAWPNSGSQPPPPPP